MRTFHFGEVPGFAEHSIFYTREELSCAFGYDPRDGTTYIGFSAHIGFLNYEDGKPVSRSWSRDIWLGSLAPQDWQLCKGDRWWFSTPENLEERVRRIRDEILASRQDTSVQHRMIPKTG